MPARSPFEVLGARPDASVAELQQAYRALVRRLHPDHLPADTSPREADGAAERLREVTAAWNDVRTPQGLAEARRVWGSADAWPPGSGGHAWSSARGWAGDGDRHGAPEEGTSSAMGNEAVPPHGSLWLPVLLAVGGLIVFAVLFVATAYLGRDRSPASRPSTITSGVCVRVRTGPVSEVVPCDGPNDGRVVGHASTAAECPAGSTARRLWADDTGVSCLVAAPHPAPPN